MLRVWLPLTKDLRQQGLDNITVTTANTNNFQNEGKLSNKSLDVSGHYAFRVPSLVKKRVFSCAFWYKPITDSSLSDNWRRIVVFDTYTSDGSTTGALFRFESSYGYQSSNTTYCISIHNNAGEPIASIGTGLGASDGWNKWQHIAITADGTTLRCYRDGVQVASGAMSNGGMLQGTVHIGYSGNRPIGRLNDLRIYDHCLSPMEIKELAKGLVLHYPLNRQGWGQENLLKNTNRGTTNWSWSSNGGSRTVTALSDGIGVRLESVTAGTQWSVLQYQDGNVKNVFVANKKYIISVDCRASYATRLNCTILDANGLNYITNTAAADKTTIANEWVHLVWKLTANSSFTVSSQEVYITNAALTAGTFFEFKNLKLEEGEIETPWCPNSSDTLATTMGLNGTTEYDCSGFCNNGEKIGALTYTSDTPKYQVSTHIGATSQKIHISGLTTSGFGNSYSFAWWGKRTSNNPMFWGFSDGIRLNGMYIGTLWNTGDGSNNPLYKIGTTTQVTAPSVNVWHHYVMTGNGTKCYVYLDGELWAEAKTYKAISGTSIYINGWNSATDYCSDNTDISDFRIYTTALSASDVKSLYQNSAYIDSSGNVYGAVHSEV